MSDPSAGLLLTALYQRHGGELLSFVRRYVPDRAAAEDVVQETMLRAWLHVERIDERRSPRSYLFTIARNVLTDRWRAQQSRPVLLADDEAIAEFPDAEEVEDAVERWTVAEALARLTPEHQAVVHALFYSGCTVAETARRLGIPVGTVKSRSYYAVRALRAALEETGVVR